MDGRPYPDLADVNAVAPPVTRHRIVMNFQGEADGVKVEDLVGAVRHDSR
jgi:MoxR-like ATPase